MDALERLRWLFDNLGLDPAYQEWFRHRAWVRTIHGTTRIEGNTLNAQEVEELLAGDGARFDRKEALEVLNTRTAIALADGLAAKREVAIDEAVIREIHRRVMVDIDPMLTPGRYRRGPNRVADEAGETIFATPASGDVPDLMRRFGIWLREGADGRPAPVAAALAHLELVAIHPFYDGNGRTARAIARLSLVRGGYALNGLVSLDAYFDQQRRDYFEAIRAAIGRDYVRGYDATPFVRYFLSAIAGAAEHVLGRVRGLQAVLNVLRREVTAGALPAPAFNGLVYAWINGSLRPADYVRVTGRTDKSASRDLGAAAKAGYVVATGRTRARRYLIGPKLEAIGRTELTPFTRASTARAARHASVRRRRS